MVKDIKANQPIDVYIQGNEKINVLTAGNAIVDEDYLDMGPGQPPSEIPEGGLHPDEGYLVPFHYAGNIFIAYYIHNSENPSASRWETNLDEAEEDQIITD
jgi:hypothetical protein